MEHLNELSFASLCCKLLIGYCIEEINVAFTYRHDVATRVWIIINFKCNGKPYDVSGSSPDIVKGRLADLVDKINGQ